MKGAVKGDLVQIEKVVLPPGERPRDLPPSSREVPYQCWIKGFLLDEEAELGQEVSIETFIGRHLRGVLYAVHPVYDHGFGRPRPELLAIGPRMRRLLAGPGEGEQ